MAHPSQSTAVPVSTTYRHLEPSSSCSDRDSVVGARFIWYEAVGRPLWISTSKQNATCGYLQWVSVGGRFPVHCFCSFCSHTWPASTLACETLWTCWNIRLHRSPCSYRLTTPVSRYTVHVLLSVAGVSIIRSRPTTHTFRKIQGRPWWWSASTGCINLPGLGVQT